VRCGLDIVEIERIKKAVERWGYHFLEHIFSLQEIEYAQKHKNSFQHFAARFAAKGAVIKALGNSKSINLKDIKIINQHNGQPLCTIDRCPIKNKIFISMSHTKKYAVANALIKE